MSFSSLLGKPQYYYLIHFEYTLHKPRLFSFMAAAGGILVQRSGTDPPCPLQWKGEVLVTGMPGKFLTSWFKVVNLLLSFVTLLPGHGEMTMSNFKENVEC